MKELKKCDPAGILTQDLQNRNLTLYTTKLRGLNTKTKKQCKNNKKYSKKQIFFAEIAVEKTTVAKMPPKCTTRKEGIKNNGGKNATEVHEV